MANVQSNHSLQLSKMEDLAKLITATASGIMIGFLCAGAAARAIDTMEAARCPNANRVIVNGGTILKEWVEWGQCPR